MTASYKKLFKLLIDREIKRKDLAAKAENAPTTIARRMRKTLSALAITLLLSFTLTGCGLDVPRPEIKKIDVDFSITYEFNGENETVSGVYVCGYEGLEWSLDGGYHRDWDGYVKDGAVDEMIKLATKSSDGRELYLVLGLYPEYFVGESTDGLWDDPAPYLMIRACDEDGGVSFFDEPDLIEEAFGAKIIEYDYPDPIENSFSVFNL